MTHKKIKKKKIMFDAMQYAKYEHRVEVQLS